MVGKPEVDQFGRSSTKARWITAVIRTSERTHGYQRNGKNKLGEEFWEVENAILRCWKTARCYRAYFRTYITVFGRSKFARFDVAGSLPQGKRRPSVPRAAFSHSASVGSRFFAQLQ